MSEGVLRDNSQALEVAKKIMDCTMPLGWDEKHGEKKYREEYEKICAYAFENFADREQGEWYGYLHYDSTVLHSLKGNVFKGPFYLPRMLMILASAQSLEEFKGYLR